MIDCGALGALEKRAVSRKRPLFVWFSRRRLGPNGFFRFVMMLVASSILDACGGRPTYHETELTIRGLGLYLAIS